MRNDSGFQIGDMDMDDSGFQIGDTRNRAGLNLFGISCGMILLHYSSRNHRWMEQRRALSLSPLDISALQGIDWTTPGLTSSLRFEAEIGVCGTTSLLLNLWTLPDINCALVVLGPYV